MHEMSIFYQNCVYWLYIYLQETICYGLLKQLQSGNIFILPTGEKFAVKSHTKFARYRKNRQKTFINDIFILYDKKWGLNTHN